MKNRQSLDATVLVGFDQVTKKELEKEAKAKGLKVASYVRSLVLTHPDRQKGGRK